MILSVCVKISHQKTSPCPAVFSYDERDDTHDTWFGTIRLKSNVPLYGIFVDIIFSSPVLAFGVSVHVVAAQILLYYHVLSLPFLDIPATAQHGR